MTHDCADGTVRDHLPDFVHGSLSAAEYARIAAHVAACADCTAEVELVRAASRAFPVPRIDVHAIIAALPAASHAASHAAARALPLARPRARRSWGAPQQWRIAAAIGFVVLGAISLVTIRGTFQPPRGASAGGSGGPSTSLAAAPARASTAGPITTGQATGAAADDTAGMSFGGGLSDLTAAQLDQLLGEIDTLEALPTAEPETHLTPIVPLDDGHGAQ